MLLAHLALTVIEDPDSEGRFRWLLLQATGDSDRVEPHSASEDCFTSASAAFQAGVVEWQAALITEDEDADPVGGDEPAGASDDV